MPIWNYQQPSFNLIPQGNYRAKISSASWDVSRASGRSMLVIDLRISARKEKIKHFIVFNSDTQETINRTNWAIKRFCDAFLIDPAVFSQVSLDLNSWIGLEAGIVVEHKKSSNAVFPVIAKFLSRQQLNFLPPFVDFQQTQQTPQQTQLTQQHTQLTQLPPQQNFSNINPEPVNPESLAIPF